MQPEKVTIVNQLLERVNASPFLLVADYTGLTVLEFMELRKRLREAGAKCQVAKNSFVRRVVRDIEYPAELEGALMGQTAFVTGDSDVCAAAKAMKIFSGEFKKLRTKAGVLEGRFLDEADVARIADLPPREALLGQFLGLLQAPATNLARLVNEPGSRVARVMKAHVDNSDNS